MTHPTQTGQLLVSAGMLSQEKLDQALTFSEEMGIPIGQVLIMAGDLDPRHLDSVLRAQSLIRKQSIDLNTGVYLLKKSYTSLLPVEQLLELCLLERSGWTQSEVTKELGQFLVAATLINHATLSAATIDAGKCRQTLTRYLLERKLVSSFHLFNSLQSLTAVRVGGLRRDHAVKALRISVATGNSFDLALKMLGASSAGNNQSIRLGKLLCRAGLISEIDLCECFETALATAGKAAANPTLNTGTLQNAPVHTILGNLLVERNLVRRDVLQSAFAVQAMQEQGSIDYQTACELIHAVHSGYGTLQHCCTQLKAFSTAVLSLLVDAKLVTEALAKQLMQSNVLDMPTALSGSGYIDEYANTTARRFQEMVNRGFLKREKAVAALRQLYTPRLPGGFLQRSA